MDWVVKLWDAAIAGLVEIADMMGKGEGFAVIFGTYMAMMLSERVLYAFARRGEWHERDAISNVLNSTFYSAFNGIITGFLFIGAYLFVYENLRLFDVPFVWWAWLLAFLLNDLAYYLDHRLGHRTGFFWAIHMAHHSSKEMNLLVANRGTVLDLGGLSSIFGIVLMSLIGIHPAMMLAVKFFANLWGIFNHTRLVGRMGWLENFLATPANHRVHHGTEPKYLDKNYGQVTVIFDRLFGTFQKEEEEPVYGLVKQMDSYRVWDIQTWGARWLIGQMRTADNWRDRLAYLVKPPGWSHEGKHETTEALQAAHGSSQHQPLRTADNARGLQELHMRKGM